MTVMGDAEVHRTLDAVWRIESARIVAVLARLVNDVGRAEELAHDALVAALEQWPADGVPDNPAAWLTTTARRRAIDAIRRDQRLARRTEELGHEIVVPGAEVAAGADATIGDDIGDELLSLVFAACHPVLAREARVALTLRLFGGLTTPEIARAFLTPEPTVAQRIVRAKKRLAGVPVEVPTGDELAPRLTSVLEVVYLVFTEGYAATSGVDWVRPALRAEAMRLGRVLVGLAPRAAEVHGLVALMELQGSRTRARIGTGGRPVLLADQDRTRWDQLLIRRGLAALDIAERLAPDPGPYALQAAIAACHARAASVEQTDWTRIAALYAELADRTGSPVVELNRAVAVGMATGPADGLAVLDALADEPALASYHLLPAVRADLLVRLDRVDEARAELERAASLARNDQEAALLTARAAALG